MTQIICEENTFERFERKVLCARNQIKKRGLLFKVDYSLWICVRNKKYCLNKSNQTTILDMFLEGKTVNHFSSVDRIADILNIKRRYIQMFMNGYVGQYSECQFLSEDKVFIDLGTRMRETEFDDMIYPRVKPMLW